MQASSDMLTRLIWKWINSIKFIQRASKNALFFKFSLYESLLIRWNDVEFLLFSQSAERKHRRRTTISLQSFKDKFDKDGVSTIPNKVKLFYIRREIRKIIQQYLQEYRDYKTEVKAIRKQNAKIVWESDEFLLEYPKPPLKPCIYTELDSEKISPLVSEALRDRSMWNSIIQHQESLSSRSHMRKTTGRGYK